MRFKERGYAGGITRKLWSILPILALICVVSYWLRPVSITYAQTQHGITVKGNPNFIGIRFGNLLTLWKNHGGWKAGALCQ